MLPTQMWNASLSQFEIRIAYLRGRNYQIASIFNFHTSRTLCLRQEWLPQDDSESRQKDGNSWISNRTELNTHYVDEKDAYHNLIRWYSSSIFDLLDKLDSFYHLHVLWLPELGSRRCPDKFRIHWSSHSSRMQTLGYSVVCMMVTARWSIRQTLPRMRSRDGWAHTWMKTYLTRSVLTLTIRTKFDQ